MNGRARASLSTAVRFASNEDEFGVFLQGFLAGAIVAALHPEEVRAAMLSTAPAEEAFCATNALYESFLASKRVVEARIAREPQFLRALRNAALDAVRETAAVAAKKGD